MCPRCLHYLRSAQLCLREDPETRRNLEEQFGRPINLDVEIIHFMEILVHYGLDRLGKSPAQLEGVEVRALLWLHLVSPAASCPAEVFSRRNGEHPDGVGGPTRYHGSFVPLLWFFPVGHQPGGRNASGERDHRDSAVASRANCLVTACAMCQLNLEIRCTTKTRLPIFHFSEILALALGAEDYETWFVRHLVDPRPVLQNLALVA